MSGSIAREERRGAFHPTALNEGLSGWVILFKDLLKKGVTALEEAELMLGSLSFLRVYSRRDPRSSERRDDRSIFDGLHAVLAQQVAQLRHLQERLRDDLVTIELLLLHDHTYEELSKPADKKASGHGVVLARPRGDLTEGRQKNQYEAALRVLWATEFPDAAHAMVDVARRWRKEGKGSPVIRAALSVIAADRDHSNPSLLRAAQQLECIKLLILLQEQPYCQPERWSLTEGDDFREHFGIWLGQTAKDDRLADVLYHTARVIDPSVLTDKSAEERIPAFLKSTLGDPYQHLSLFVGAVIQAIFTPSSSTDSSTDADQKQDKNSAHPLDALIERIVATREFNDVVEFLIDVAEECWQRRRARVLGHVARFRRGDVFEVDGSTLNPIHEVFFRRISRYQYDFETAFSSLRSIIQSIQQRAAILPPGFPPVPRFHRREREAVESSLLSVLRRMGETTKTTIELLRRSPAHLPVLSVEMSFEYAVVSEVRAFNSATAVKAVTVVVPFFLLDIPRQMADVVHEIAHAYITNDEVAGVLARDPEEWQTAQKTWNPRVAQILRWTGGALKREYERIGTRTHDDVGILSEVLADFVALLVVGPHYLYSLLFTTIGFSDVPNERGDATPADFLNPTEISPMVRLGALIRVAYLLWEDARGADDVIFFRQPQLQPVVHIWKAYFRILGDHGEQGEDWRQQRRRDLFLKEIEILGDGLCAIVEHLRSEERRQKRRLIRVTVDDGAPGADLEDALGRALNRIPGAAREAQPCLEKRRYLIVTGDSANANREDLMKDNLVHLLWSAVLDRYPDVGRQFLAADINGAPLEGEAEQSGGSRRQILEQALWLRAPEIRIMDALLSDPGKAEGGNLNGEGEWISPQTSLSRERPRPGDLVTITQVDAFWWHRGNINSSWEEAKRVGGLWVLGDHDFHFMEPRFSVEDLSRPVVVRRARLPAQPRYCYLRCLDYIVHGPPPDGSGVQEDSGTPWTAEAFFQLRLKKTLAPATFVEIVKSIEIKDGSGAPGVKRTEYILQSLGWDHYGLRVGFSTFQCLSKWWQQLRQRLHDRDAAIQYHTMNILYQPGFWGYVDCFKESYEDGKLAHDARLEIAFVSRFHCRHAGGDPLTQAERCLRNILKKADRSHGVRKLVWHQLPGLVISITLRATTGHDDLELCVEVWCAKQPELDQDACTKSIELYVWLVVELASASSAFDVQTTVLLPVPDDDAGSG